MQVRICYYLYTKFRLWKDDMLNKLLILAAGSALCLSFSCKEETAYTVKVKLDNLKGEDIYAVFEADDAKKVDTLSYETANDFTVVQERKNFRSLTLYFQNHTQWVTVYLETQKRITVTGDMLYPQLIKVKGGTTNDLLSGFREKAASLLKERTDLTHPAGSSQENLNTSRLANINHELCLQAEAFVRKYPGEEASAILIKEYLSDPETPLRTDEWLDLLAPEQDGFYVVKELRAACEKAKRTMTGAQAPGFNVSDITGKPYDRNSFFNRYFILAFVAMWQEECQTKELLLDEVITAFPEDSLGVLLVSLDENLRQVREQVAGDSIRWNIVADSAGQAIALMDTYNVGILPSCYLIDREGNILLKTDNGIELKQALGGLLKENANIRRKNDVG
jgi:peroxiredoxin